jgi:Uma2 family endonuclease
VWFNRNLTANLFAHSPLSKEGGLFFAVPDRLLKRSTSGRIVLVDVLEKKEVERGQVRLLLHTRPVLEIDNDQFFKFCRLNKDFKIERSAEGDLIIMPPEGGSSGHGNLKLASFFDDWATRDGTGRAFGPSTGFILPNGATRSPDVSWVLNERLDILSDEEWEGFLPLCPDFVLELRSPSDALSVLQEKMIEYMANGARLGWLLDPRRKQVQIYRPDRSPERLVDPPEIFGESVLPGFCLRLPELWAAMNRQG